jgi:alpha-beta hydrolase superfamily lysophospholipase
MVRGRHAARASRRRALGIIVILLGGLIACIPACSTPVTQTRLTVVNHQIKPHFDVENSTMIAHDGAALGLTVWPATGEVPPANIVVAVHGMNDYANAFHMAAPYWAARGVTTYAYDQRGFGRSIGKGVWPDQELMQEDLRTAVALARQAHPEATISVVGVSMGAAVAIAAFGSDRPPDADRLIASGPGLRGWGAMNPLYRASLWVSAHARPSWIVKPPRRFVHIEPSDNIEMLRRTWSDPLMTYENRIDQVYGVVGLMETAHDRVPYLPTDLPVLMSYGANDFVIPPAGVKRTARTLPPHVRTVFYDKGYHMLLRDLQAENVFADYLSFIMQPDDSLPSKAPAWPWHSQP